MLVVDRHSMLVGEESALHSTGCAERVVKWGMIPNVKFASHGKSATDDIHIYGSVVCVFVSWKTAKGLGILPETYPHPATASQVCQPSTPPVPTAEQFCLISLRF